MNNIISQKKEIRKIFKEKRFSLSQDEVENKSKKISNNFINNLLPKLLNDKNLVFSVYLDSYNEVETKFIIDFFVKNNIKFCYPKIAESSYILDFVTHQENQVFDQNNLFNSIKEPLNGEKILPDILIMPLVSCDKKSRRLGMGGGYFDRSLSHFTTLNHKFITIGLAYDFQLFDGDIPVEDTDQSLDFIVFEDIIIS